jgi:hypothetical protein
MEADRFSRLQIKETRHSASLMNISIFSKYGLHLYDRKKESSK